MMMMIMTFHKTAEYIVIGLELGIGARMYLATHNVCSATFPGI